MMQVLWHQISRSKEFSWDIIAYFVMGLNSQVLSFSAPYLESIAYLDF